MTRELTIEEIDRLETAFEFAAEVAGSAGVDALEINCHAGYLIDQFHTSLWNRRMDKYGGDLENRLRLLVEIVQRIKKVLGTTFPVIVKFGVTHYFDGGRDVYEGLEIARRLQVAGVDALCVDAGCFETHHWVIPSEFQPPGCTLHLAETVKKVVDIPVIAVGKLGYPQLAEMALREGNADFVALGRTLLADPEWPNKVKESRFEDVRPCICCLEGCRSRVHAGKAISCAVNPMTGNERELALRPAERKKSVLVIGGGPAGLEAARIAAMRGHEVALWEKSGTLGGNLVPASTPEFKREYRNLRNYLSAQIQKLGVDIKLEKDATPELIQAAMPEVVFVATGSTPVIPEIRAVGSRNTVTAVDLLLGKKEPGDYVVIIGGGLVGCETALYLAQKGKTVTIVEILESVARDMYSLNREHLLELLSDAHVAILTGTRVLEIVDQTVLVANEHNEKISLKADTIVLAVGLRPSGELVDRLSDLVPEVYAVGDCVEPRKVIHAIWEGFRMARLI
jgi:2-enoate reductase